MTSEIFKYVVMSATFGAVFGVILKHCLDTKYIKEINQIHEDLHSKLKDEYKRYELELEKHMNYYKEHWIAAQAELNAIKYPKKSKAVVDDSFLDVFNETEPVPEGWVELDFPNSKKED